MAPSHRYHKAFFFTRTFVAIVLAACAEPTATDLAGNYSLSLGSGDVPIVLSRDAATTIAIRSGELRFDGASGFEALSRLIIARDGVSSDSTISGSGTYRVAGERIMLLYDNGSTETAEKVGESLRIISTFGRLLVYEPRR